MLQKYLRNSIDEGKTMEYLITCYKKTYKGKSK